MKTTTTELTPGLTINIYLDPDLMWLILWAGDAPAGFFRLFHISEKGLPLCQSGSFVFMVQACLATPVTTDPTESSVAHHNHPLRLPQLPKRYTLHFPPQIRRVWGFWEPI